MLVACIGRVRDLQQIHLQHFSRLEVHGWQHSYALATRSLSHAGTRKRGHKISHLRTYLANGSGRAVGTAFCQYWGARACSGLTRAGQPPKHMVRLGPTYVLPGFLAAPPHTIPTLGRRGGTSLPLLRSSALATLAFLRPPAPP